MKTFLTLPLTVCLTAGLANAGTVVLAASAFPVVYDYAWCYPDDNGAACDLAFVPEEGGTAVCVEVGCYGSYNPEPGTGPHYPCQLTVDVVVGGRDSYSKRIEAADITDDLEEGSQLSFVNDENTVEVLLIIRDYELGWEDDGRYGYIESFKFAVIGRRI